MVSPVPYPFRTCRVLDFCGGRVMGTRKRICNPLSRRTATKNTFERFSLHLRTRFVFRLVEFGTKTTCYFVLYACWCQNLRPPSHSRNEHIIRNLAGVKCHWSRKKKNLGSRVRPTNITPEIEKNSLSHKQIKKNIKDFFFPSKS